MNQALFALRNIADKLVKITNDPKTLGFYWQTYVLSKFDKPDPDVYLVSYPKCGRTWLRVMLQKYLEKQGIPSQQFKDKSFLNITKKKIIKFEHDQASWVPAPPKTKQLHFKTNKYANKKIIFLVRDPRDVLVSSWHHLKYRERIYPKGLSEFIHDDLVGIHKIIAFMNLWLKHRDIPKKFYLMTYEELHHNPKASFKKLLKFIGLKANPQTVDYAIKASSFKKMKQMELKGSLQEPWMKPGRKNLKKSLKVRSGKIGSFKQELNKKDIDYLDKEIQDKLSPKLSFYYE